MILKGACIHHDNGVLGACVFVEAEERKIHLLKQVGYNAIRSAHNPCSKAMLPMCDWKTRDAYANMDVAGYNYGILRYQRIHGYGGSRLSYSRQRTAEPFGLRRRGCLYVSGAGKREWPQTGGSAGLSKGETHPVCIYELCLNGKKVGNQYFAPGFTSYKTHLQYQTYDVTQLLDEQNTLSAVVGGGWAVGAFVFTRVNRVTANRLALLLELRITYEDGTSEVIGSDESWQVTED